MTITITEAVHVDIRIDGETISTDYKPGTADVPLEIAELLIAQGFATEGSVAKSKSDTTPTEA